MKLFELARTLPDDTMIVVWDCNRDGECREWIARPAKELRGSSETEEVHNVQPGDDGEVECEVCEAEGYFLGGVQR